MSCLRHVGGGFDIPINIGMRKWFERPFNEKKKEKLLGATKHRRNVSVCQDSTMNRMNAYHKNKRP